MRAAFGLFDRDGDGTISVKVNRLIFCVVTTFFSPFFSFSLFFSFFSSLFFLFVLLAFLGAWCCFEDYGPSDDRGGCSEDDKGDLQREWLLLVTGHFSRLIVYHYPQVADTDGSGSVEFEEFLEMICDQIEVG